LLRVALLFTERKASIVSFFSTSFKEGMFLLLEEEVRERSESKGVPPEVV
jgi:hypothetical protein